MNLLAVVLSALLAGVTLLLPRLGAAAETQEVLLLEPAGYPDRWLEAEHRVAAELETAGFRVVRRRLAATDQETLMRGLVNSAPAFASFVMLREGPGGAAFVWLSGTARIKRFAMSDVTSSRAAGAIALRVTEYLNMQVLTISVPSPTPEPHSTDEEPIHTATRSLDMAAYGSATPRDARGRFWLGPGVVFSSDSQSLAPSGSIGLGVVLAKPFSLEVNADLMPVPLLVESHSGTTKVSGNSLRLFAQFEAFLASSWSLSVGLGGGLLRVTSESEAKAGFQAQTDAASTALLAGRGRITYQTENGFRLLASIDPALSLPPISVRADAREFARLGRPWFSTTLGVGWSF